jgi:hypothetical protein
VRHAPEFDAMEFLRGEYWRLAEERRQRRLAQQVGVPGAPSRPNGRAATGDAGKVAERHGAQGDPATATRETPARETPLRVTRKGAADG